MPEGCQQFRVMDTDEWTKTHRPHGEAIRHVNENQPPEGTYTLYTLVCPCGSRHTICEESSTEQARVLKRRRAVMPGYDKKLEEWLS